MKELCKHYRCNLLKIRKYRRIRQFEKATELQKENVCIKARIEEYIDSIDDCMTRLIFKERIFQGRSWQGVAMILGGNNTADGVRQRFMRQFRKN